MSGRRWFPGRAWLLVLGAFQTLRFAHKDPEFALVALGLAAVVVIIVWLERRPRRAGPEIVFLESDGRPLPAGSRCLICRDPLSGDVIYCVRCHTPHHRACFRYLGACSVYACRSDAFRKAA